jgi:uncharacterized protein YcfJ
MPAHKPLLLTLALVAGCATTPTSPTIAVMPAPDKPFQVFIQDETACRAYASQQVAGEAERANGRTAAGAIIGTAVGAGLGSAIGNGHGATVGAIYGGTIGTVAGASSGQGSGGIQRQYDIAYSQCMYAKGNQVPGFASPSAGPPPPPGYPPPRH